MNFKQLLKLMFLFLTLAKLSSAQTKTIVLDNYFNDEFKKNQTGKMVSFHNKWDEKANTGFSILGEKFDLN